MASYGDCLLFYMNSVFVSQRKHSYGPPRPLEVPPEAWLDCTLHSTVGEVAAQARGITTGIAMTFAPPPPPYFPDKSVETSKWGTGTQSSVRLQRAPNGAGSSEWNCCENCLYTDRRQRETTGRGLSSWPLTSSPGGTHRFLWHGTLLLSSSEWSGYDENWSHCCKESKSISVTGNVGLQCSMWGMNIVYV
jgi:hypothetical protein